MKKHIAYKRTAQTLHGCMKCLLAVLVCLLLSAPSFAHSTVSAIQKVNNGSWTAYNIGRDYLGSITHIVTSSGTLVAEYSYDPWGRLRNPATQAIYTPGTEPTLFLGRGYTGHEHLTWFGLINMNARLYDPLLGRFLSPDPYVQAPDFTQNFNRYSYALNNPLRYKDPNGEFALTTLFWVACISAAVFGAGNVAAHAIRGEDLSSGKWIEYLMTGSLAGFAVGALGYAGITGMTALAGMSGFWGGVGKAMLYGTIGAGVANTGATLTSFVGGAITHGGEGLANAGKMFLGNFYLDENKSFWGQVGEGILRHTWEAPQQAIGYFWSSARNTVGAVDRVDYYKGATYITNENSEFYQGVTLGNMINMDIWGEIPSSVTFEYYVENIDQMYAHEYGHTIQSKMFGLTYPIIGLLSLGSAISEFVFKTGHKHDNYFTEVMANRFAQPLFPSYKWGTRDYPTIY